MLFFQDQFFQLSFGSFFDTADAAGRRYSHTELAISGPLAKQHVNQTIDFLVCNGYQKKRKQSGVY